MKKINDSSTISRQTDINTPDGIGKYEGIKISELGKIMIKVYFHETDNFVNYTVGSIDELLVGSQLHLCK